MDHLKLRYSSLLRLVFCHWNIRCDGPSDYITERENENVGTTVQRGLAWCKFSNEFNVFHVRALYYTKTLITNKCTKRVLSSIVTHSYMFLPCWVIFRECIFVIVTLRLHFIVEWECAVDCALRCFWRREFSAVPACKPSRDRRQFTPPVQRRW
jgi:hypothetical protein